MRKINYFFKAAKIAVKKISPAIMIVSFVASGFVYSIPPAQAALVPGGAVGPVAPAGGLGAGFPLWYMDQNGLALELMEAADGFGLSAAPTPGFGETVGFGAEGFYWAAEAIPAPTVNSISGEPISGILVQALEAAFAGETAVDGEQSVFGRLRFRVDGLIIGETYTVVTPFGTFTSVATDSDGNGPKLVGDINETFDIGCFAIAGVSSCDPNVPAGNPSNFGLALQSNIGPFLTWDTFNLNPALTDPLLVNAQNPTKRYIGNPNIEHAITGGPNGNSFTVTGLGIPSFTTNLFTVVGRIAVIDTIAPVIVSAIPSSVTLGSTNVVARANITDNLGATSATIDLGSLGSDLSATLNGSQEVPPIGSTATGAGAFTIDTTANTLSFNISFSGLPAGDIEATSHIHNAAVGVNGPIVFDLPAGTSKIGVWNYPEALEAEILAGRTYVQIHSVLFPAGAIRGQILPNANIQNMILTAGTKTDGTWSVIIPGALSRLGTFNLPIVVSDGSNTANGALSLTVNVLTSVSVAPPAASLAIGATQQLTASPLDNTGGAFSGATVTWTSSNNGVATVDANGSVTAVAPGTAAITATAVSGAITKTASANITVAAVTPVFTSISVTPATGSAAIGGTLQLTATALDQAGGAMIPQPAIAWALVNPADAAIATVSATGLVTGVSAGGPIAVAATSGLISGSSNITVSAAPVCQTAADTNLDGAIGNAEILSYIGQWKIGNVANLLILQAIGFWKTGVGC